VAAFAVSRKLGCYMVWINRLVIVRFVASKTAVRGVIIIPVMAVAAIVSDGGMRTQQGVIIVMNGEGGWDPVRVSGMAGAAVVGYL
jgi:hypothetical protein